MQLGPFTPIFGKLSFTEMLAEATKACHLRSTCLVLFCFVIRRWTHGGLELRHE
jgi:hypothetical protein